MYRVCYLIKGACGNQIFKMFEVTWGLAFLYARSSPGHHMHSMESL